MNETERINEVIRRLIKFYGYESERMKKREYENIISFMQGELSGYTLALNIIAEEFEIDIQEIYKKIEICIKEEK